MIVGFSGAETRAHLRLAPKSVTIKWPFLLLDRALVPIVFCLIS